MSQLNQYHQESNFFIILPQLAILFGEILINGLLNSYSNFAQRFILCIGDWYEEEIDLGFFLKKSCSLG
jgi:hypothetical protein